MEVIKNVIKLKVRQKFHSETTFVYEIKLLKDFTKIVYFYTILNLKFNLNFITFWY